MIATVEPPSLVASKPNGVSLRGTMTAQDTLAYQYTVYTAIRDVDAEEWNGLRNASRDPFMDPGFIEAVENSMGSVCRFRHVVVRDKAGRPLAAACLSSYTVDGAALAEGSAKVILSRDWPVLALVDAKYDGDVRAADLERRQPSALRPSRRPGVCAGNS